jgi:carboxypeptidase PM20D1
VKSAINDPMVEVKALPESSEASKMVDTNSPAYRSVARTIIETFGVPVAPDVSEATDSRHYLGSADAVLRFRPFPADPSDLDRVRGANERVAIADLGAAVGFYLRLIQNSQ